MQESFSRPHLAATLSELSLNEGRSTRSAISSFSSTHISDNDRMPSPAVSVFRSIACHAYTCVRQVAKISTSRDRSRPDMRDKRRVTPVYDVELQRWVFPVDPTVLKGKPCKDLSTSKRPKSSAESTTRSSSLSSTTSRRR